MGDRITVLHEGFIQQVDNPLNLYDHPVNMFVAGFIGSPAMNFITGKIKDDAGNLKFIATGIDIPLTEKQSDQVKDYADKKIIFGIRPENIVYSEKGNITATVDVIEPMGNEIILYCTIEDIKFVVRMETRLALQPGDSINLTMKEEYFHFFDPETESSLVYELDK